VTVFEVVMRCVTCRCGVGTHTPRWDKTVPMCLLA